MHFSHLRSSAELLLFLAIFSNRAPPFPHAPPSSLTYTHLQWNGIIQPTLFDSEGTEEGSILISIPLAHRRGSSTWRGWPFLGLSMETSHTFHLCIQGCEPKPITPLFLPQTMRRGSKSFVMFDVLPRPPHQCPN